MNKPTFWYLGYPESTAKCARWVDKEMRLESLICPAESGHRRAGKRLTDLSIALPSGAVQDFVWTWYSECLVQDNVLEMFRANDVTGFEVKPVSATFVKKRFGAGEPPRLWEIVVTGWAGLASEESGIKAVGHCNACGLITYSEPNNAEGLIIASQWDGSDMFMVWPLPKHIFISDRLAQLIRESRLSGVTIKSLDALNVFGPTFSGARLSWYMPEARARKLGAPLGIY